MLHQIGSGVFGPVFRAVDPDGDRIVAIKLFRLDWPPEQARALAGALETLIETLPAHPNLVMPLASGLESGTAWLAQEFVGADSLEARLRRRTPVTANEAVALLRQVGAALDLAAGAGWRHGALHPRDILVDTGGGVHVTGIGVAQIVERFGARPHRRRPYTAPERAIAAGWDTRADVFALATIASEMLGPRRSRGQSDEARVASFSEAGFNGRLAADVLNRGMSNVAGERPVSATALVDALEATVGVPEESTAFAADQPAPAELSLFDAPAPVPTPWDEPEPETPAREASSSEPPDADLAETLALSRTRDDEPRPDVVTIEAAADRVGDIATAPASPAPDDDWEIARPEPTPPPVVLDDEVAAAAAPPAARGLEWEEESAPSAPAVPARGPWSPPLDESFQSAPSASHQPWGLLAGVLIVGLAIGFAGGRLSRSGASPSPASSPAPAGTAVAQQDVREEPVRGESEPGVQAAKPTASAPSTSAPVTPPASATSPATATSPAAQPAPKDATPAAKPPARTPAAAPTKPAPPPAPAPAGRLLVRTSPAGARVKIDGKDRGASPLTLRDLAFGSYAVEVTRSGYASETRRVQVTARRPAQSLDIRLKANTAPATAGAAASGATASPTGRASLELVTRPPGARVFVDGEFVGTTPLRMVDVTPGPKNVRFEMGGYAKWAAAVTVAPGESRKVAASLDPLP